MLELETKTHSRSQLTGSVSGTLAVRSRVQMGTSGVLSSLAGLQMFAEWSLFSGPAAERPGGRLSD